VLYKLTFINCSNFTLAGNITKHSSFFSKLPYFIEYSAHFFYIENGAEIFLVHYAWKVDEKGFKMGFMLNKLAMINSFEIILEKYK
jgi:hypothetical protein